MLFYGKEGNEIAIFEILKTYSSKVFQNSHYILRNESKCIYYNKQFYNFS